MIDTIKILSLREREDRRARCVEIMQGYDYEFFLTERDPDNLYERASSDFVELLKQSEGTALIFEDDFELSDNWDEVLNKAWEYLPSDYDLLYLGANLTAKPKRITSNLVKLNGAWCVHAVVYSPRFKDYIINNYNYNDCGVFDDWLRRFGGKFYMTYPMVSWQRESHSDFQNTEVNYNLFTNQHYLKL